MAQGCAGSFVSAESDLRALRDQCRAVLDTVGCKTWSRSRPDGQFRLEAQHGNPLFGMLASLMPSLDLFGWFSRQKVVLVGRQSLDEGDSSLRLSLRVAPLGEWTGREESFLLGQSVEEYVGDNLKARRLYRRLCDELRHAGVIGEE